MADDTTAGSGNPAGAAGVPGAPGYSMLAQYIRDLSFENPGAPGSILSAGQSPQFQVNINIGVKKQADDVYAVEINLTAKAEREQAVLFNVELVYGGVFRVRNVPENQLGALLMVECPRMLFPFARHALATVVQLGGFPAVMMEPVDFQALYIQNLKALQAQQGNGAAPTQA
jgi:preprotein translocase subunit SecB